MCLPTEPFKVEREWKHAGLKCAVVLAREAGHRCGYVRVPPGHPDHGKDYGEVDADVHGGLTFSGIEPCAEEDGTGYWFGFDCAHAGDEMYDPDAKAEDCTTEKARALLLIHRSFFSRPPGHYWTVPEVVAEVERLAAQFATKNRAA